MTITRLRRGLVAATAFACGVAGTGALIAPAAMAASAKTLYVSATATSDPSCAAASQSNPFATLAGALACAGNGATIHIGSGTFTAGVTIGRNVSVVGSGAGTVLVPAASANASPVITDAPDTTVKLSDLTINGTDRTLAGIQADSGALSVTGVTVENAWNSLAGGGGIQVAPASGSAKVTVSDSTFTNDFAHQAGGIYVGSASGQPASTLTVANSTFTNDDGLLAGGLAVGNAHGTVLNSTFDDSTGSGQNPTSGVNVTALGGSLSLGNDLIDAAAGEVSCAGENGTSVVDLGNNLLSAPASGTCANAITNGANGDQVGSTTQPINPMLGPLASSGGQTQTEALQAGSPAIGTANPTLCTNAPVNNRDQRGKTRNTTTRNACDIGAYDTGGTAG